MRAMVPDGHGSVTVAEVDDLAPGAAELVVSVDAYSVNRGETFLLESPAAVSIWLNVIPCGPPMSASSIPRC